MERAAAQPLNSEEEDGQPKEWRLSAYVVDILWATVNSEWLESRRVFAEESMGVLSGCTDLI
jgi:hypothetical protein